MLATLLISTTTLELYERLGLSKDVSVREIKKAWHLMALRLHPDKVEGSAREKEEAAASFKAAAEAYEVLSEPLLRTRYDSSGADLLRLTTSTSRVLCAKSSGSTLVCSPIAFLLLRLKVKVKLKRIAGSTTSGDNS